MVGFYGNARRDFRTFIQRYTSPNETFEYGYSQSKALLQFPLKMEQCELYNAARHTRNCDVINDIKMYPAVYPRIYCH